MLLQKQNKNKHGMKYYKDASHEWNMIIMKMNDFVYIKKKDSVKHRIAQETQ